MATLKDWKIYSITQWVFFTYNYPEPEPFFKELFGEDLGAHIYDKWMGYNCNWNFLFTSLDIGDRQKLADWVSENYQGMSSFRPE